MENTDFSLKKYLNELETLVNIDSGSRYPEGTAKVADFFRKKFIELGWSANLQQFDSAVGPCLEITNSDKDQYDILLIGHMDTVFPAGTVEKWSFSTDKDRAYGPGVYDMKSALLSAYYVLKDLNSKGLLDNTSICLAFNSDEEISSIHSRPWLEKLAAKSRRALVLEPARPNGALVYKRKGVGRYTIEFNGVASHAGNKPEEGISAINELGHWITALHSLTNFENGTTVNVGLVTGGTTANVVADYARAEVDVRVVDIAEAQKIEQTMQNLIANPKTPGIKVKVSGRLTRPPMNPSEEMLKLYKVLDDIADRLGINISWVASGGGSDANITAAMGIPSVDGLGPIGGAAHGTKEYLELDSIEPRMQLLREFLVYLTKN